MRHDDLAERCVVTGKPAYASHGNPVQGFVKGWYGSTVVDALSPMVALDPGLPVGPVCDDVLKGWLREGKLVDIEDIKTLRVDPFSMDPAILRAIVDVGARIALHYLDIDDGKVLGYEDMSHQREFLVYPFINTEGRMNGIEKHPGPDLLAVGRIMALVARARGRPFDQEERDRAIHDQVHRMIRESNLFENILGAMDEKKEAEPERKPATWLRGVVVDGVVPEELDTVMPPAARLRSMVLASRFEEADAYLAAFDVSTHSSITLIGMMRMVEAYRGELSAWGAFRDAAVAHMKPSERIKATALRGLLEDEAPSPTP